MKKVIVLLFFILSTNANAQIPTLKCVERKNQHEFQSNDLLIYACSEFGGTLETRYQRVKNGPAEIYKNLDHGSRNKLQLLEAGEYKSDLKHGAWKVYSPDGKVKILGQYDKDQPFGIGNFFQAQEKL